MEQNSIAQPLPDVGEAAAVTVDNSNSDTLEDSSSVDEIQCVSKPNDRLQEKRDYCDHDNILSQSQSLTSDSNINSNFATPQTSAQFNDHTQLTSNMTEKCAASVGDATGNEINDSPTLISLDNNIQVKVETQMSSGISPLDTHIITTMNEDNSASRYQDQSMMEGKDPTESKGNETPGNIDATVDTESKATEERILAIENDSSADSRLVTEESDSNMDRRIVPTNSRGMLPRQYQAEAEEDLHEKQSWIEQDVQALR